MTNRSSQMAPTGNRDEVKPETSRRIARFFALAALVAGTLLWLTAPAMAGGQDSMVVGVGSVNVVDGTVPAMPAETGGLGSFKLVCRQANGSAVPTGRVQFRFQPGDYPNLTEDYSFTFRSTGYSSLAVDGGKAVCQGTGKVDGRGDFGFRLVAVQSDPGLGGEPDYFRIIIWDKDSDDLLLIDTAVWLTDLDAVDAYDGALRSGFVTIR